MKTEPTHPTVAVVAPPQRPHLTIEDVHTLLGRYIIELEILRRENAALRAQLEATQSPNGGPVPMPGA